MAKDANDLAHAGRSRRTRTASPAFAALPTADPGPRRGARALRHAAGVQRRDDPRHARREFPRREEILGHLERAQALGVPLYLHPTLPHPDALKATSRIRGARARGLGVRGRYERHFLRIVFGGVFDAYPRLKIVLGHLAKDCLRDHG